MQYQDIVQQVGLIRPNWAPQAIYFAVKGARDRTSCDMITLAAVAMKVALDPTAKTPTVIQNHPALVGGSIDANTRNDGTPDPDRPSLHPDLTGPEQLCAHGLDVRLRTSDDRPRCPSCRGVTRTMRNGSNEPSRVAQHAPAPSRGYEFAEPEGEDQDG